jgi:hypothetical protein
MKGATDRKRHDTFAALFVDLDGTLDRLKALELISRIKEAVNRARMDLASTSNALSRRHQMLSRRWWIQMRWKNAQF